jgi:hypothetical protein
VEGSGGTSGLTPADGATWPTYDGVNPWTTPGGDFDPQVIDDLTLSSQAPQWYRWDVTDLVDDWKQGVHPNHGLMLRGIGGLLRKMHIVSSDAGTAREHPKLTVTYLCPCGLPCSPPLAAGENLLMVVSDPPTPTPNLAENLALFTEGGVVVTLIDDGASATDFASAFGAGGLSRSLRRSDL